MRNLPSTDLVLNTEQGDRNDHERGCSRSLQAEGLNKGERERATSSRADVVLEQPQRNKVSPELEIASDPLPYKVICISLYTGDLERLDLFVSELKRRGLRKANRSWLIRHALAQLDLDTIAPQKG